MTDLKDMQVAPWLRFQWSGELRSVDGTPNADFVFDDVAELIAEGGAGYNFAAIVRLHDGRFASWDAMWDVTGDGFCCDAYGGDADIFFAETAEAAARALGEQTMETLTWAKENAK